MLVETYSASKAYVKIDLATLIDLLTCETLQPLFRNALKCAFMSARLMLRTLREEWLNPSCVAKIQLEEILSDRTSVFYEHRKAGA